MAERDKRVRAEGLGQYQPLEGRYASYKEDPYTPKDFSREPLTDEVDVAIVGGGFSGLIAAGRLRQAGVENLRIIEGGADFGGTWYWNRYPGVRCDVESYIYMPFLEELGYVPTEKYAGEGNLRPLSGDRTVLQPVPQRRAVHDGAAHRVGRRRRSVGDPHQPRRRDEGEVRLSGGRHPAPTEAAASARNRGIQGAFVPHQPLGLRLHRRRHGRRADKAAGEAGWHHRDGGDSHPVHSSPRPDRR